LRGDNYVFGQYVSRQRVNKGEDCRGTIAGISNGRGRVGEWPPADLGNTLEYGSFINE